jgi:hypothetical protein
MLDSESSAGAIAPLGVFAGMVVAPACVKTVNEIGLARLILPP